MTLLNEPPRHDQDDRSAGLYPAPAEHWQGDR